MSKSRYKDAVAWVVENQDANHKRLTAALRIKSPRDRELRSTDGRFYISREDGDPTWWLEFAPEEDCRHDEQFQIEGTKVDAIAKAESVLFEYLEDYLVLAETQDGGAGDD